MFSNNSFSPLYAKLGDTITLNISISEAVPSSVPRVTIESTQVAATLIDSNVFTATYIMQSGDPQGFINFSVSCFDLAGNEGPVVDYTTPYFQSANITYGIALCLF
jgi:hypothetical protein